MKSKRILKITDDISEAQFILIESSDGYDVVMKSKKVDITFCCLNKSHAIRLFEQLCASSLDSIFIKPVLNELRV